MYRRRLHVVPLLLLFLALAAPATASGLTRGVPSSKFQPSGSCFCHGFLVWQWSGSMHSKALEDPLYKYKLAEADNATKGRLSAFCNTCHGPVATMAGEIHGLDQSKLSASSREAITCDFCHQVTALGSPLVNNNQMVTPDGVKRAQLEDSKSSAHKTALSPIHASAEFCAPCHDVDHPGTGLHLETAYREWKASPYAKEGVVCQDCHMSPQPGTAAAGAPQRDRIYMMNFIGPNAGLGNKAAAEQLLRDSVTLKLKAPDTVADKAEVTVTVRNSGAGHYLPTGLTDVRQMWLEVTFADRDGKELAKHKREYGTILKDAKGTHPVELWQATAVYKDDRIPPRQESANTYPIPEASTGGVSVKAALYYRSAPEEMAKKAGVEIPTTLMASAQTFVPAEAGKPVAGAAEAPAAAEAASEDSAEDGLGRFTGVAILGAALLLLGTAGFLLRKRFHKPDAD